MYLCNLDANTGFDRFKGDFQNEIGENDYFLAKKLSVLCKLIYIQG